MTHTQLNRAVARATGETVATIRSMGFEIDADRPGGDPENDGPCCWTDCAFCRQPILLSARGAEELPELAECAQCETVFEYESEEIYEAEPDEVHTRLADIEAQRAAA